MAADRTGAEQVPEAGGDTRLRVVATDPWWRQSDKAGPLWPPAGASGGGSAGGALAALCSCASGLSHQVKCAEVELKLFVELLT